MNTYAELRVERWPESVELSDDPVTYIPSEEWLPLHFEVNYHGEGRIEIYDETKTTVISPGEPILPGIYYVKGTTLSSEMKDIELKLVHDYTEFEDKIYCAVGGVVQIVDVIMPNGFIATPSLSNEQRFNSTYSLYQVAKTDVRIWYYLDENVTWDSAWADFYCNGKVYEIPGIVPAEPGLNHADVSLELKSPQQPDENYDWALDDNVQFQVILTARLSGSVTFNDTVSVPGCHLLKELDFSPRAYQANEYGTPSDPVCPYTHVHAPFSGDPANTWYGLLTTYSLPSSVVLNDVAAWVWAGNLPTKTLATPAGALDGTNCRFKWEGYDNSVPEPAEVPYFVFPEDIDIQTQHAPECVVAEGLYRYNMEATDSRGVTHPNGTLTQSYEIYNIPIHVRYNMTDVEIPE